MYSNVSKNFRYKIRFKKNIPVIFFLMFSLSLLPAFVLVCCPINFFPLNQFLIKHTDKNNEMQLSDMTLKCTEVQTKLEKNFIKTFEIKKDFLYFSRNIIRNNYFDQIGRKFAILGYENGNFEVWGFPFKILRDFELSFVFPDKANPEPGEKFIKTFETTPEVKILTYANQYFTLKEIFIVPKSFPGAIILLNFYTVRPLTVIVNFIPVLQPMWPGSLGGQYCFWDDKLNAYIISESRRKFNAVIGSPSGIRISSPPAHQFSDAPYQFKIELPANLKGEYFIPVAITGGMHTRDEARKFYEELINEPEKFYKENLNYYDNFNKNALRIETPDKDLNLAFLLAKLALDSLFIENPDLGEALVAGFGASGGSGRPGFGWYFGGDSFINSFSLNSFGNFMPVKKSLEFFKRYQRQDGKITHEISQSAGMIKWFEEYPYAFIHADTTPFYIWSFYDYVRTSGDVEFLKESWESIKKAFHWCISTDENSDGLMDNKKAGLGALEFGQMIGVLTDVYLGGIWVKALDSFIRMSEIIGDNDLKSKAEEIYQKASENLKNKFWDDKKESYIYAIGEKEEKISAITPWPSLAISFGLLEGKKLLKTIEKMASSEISTSWGCRVLSKYNEIYDPLNYNYGAVWPFITGFVSLSMYKFHQNYSAYFLLKGAIRNHLMFFYGGCHEVFSGENFIPLNESVPHQGFSSNGFLLPLIKGLLGLSVDSLKNVVHFNPQIPEEWKFLNVENVKINDNRLSLYLKKQDGKINLKILKNGDDRIDFQFSPFFPFGTKILKVKLNDKDIPFKIKNLSSGISPDIKFSSDKKDILEIQFTEGPVILVPEEKIQVGDTDRFLKITGIYGKGKKLEILFEGISGKEYFLKI
ncbi:MAG: GH116 family glycosyl hydrolase, partial [Acidobacteriota bacterium]